MLSNAAIAVIVIFLCVLCVCRYYLSLTAISRPFLAIVLTTCFLFLNSFLFFWLLFKWRDSASRRTQRKNVLALSNDAKNEHSPWTYRRARSGREEGMWQKVTVVDFKCNSQYYSFSRRVTDRKCATTTIEQSEHHHHHHPQSVALNVLIHYFPLPTHYQ